MLTQDDGAMEARDTTESSLERVTTEGNTLQYIKHFTLISQISLGAIPSMCRFQLEHTAPHAKLLQKRYILT
jgi:hypothetical protein